MMKQEKINIHCYGSLDPLGKLMSNLANAPITVEEGWFKSVEAYWYWLQTHDQQIRYLHGVEAKKWGQQSKKEMPTQLTKSDPIFREKIITAVKIKIANHPEIRKLFNENTLPFEHKTIRDGQEIDMSLNSPWWLASVNALRVAKGIHGDKMWEKYEYDNTESSK